MKTGTTTKPRVDELTHKKTLPVDRTPEMIESLHEAYNSLEVEINQFSDEKSPIHLEMLFSATELAWELYASACDCGALGLTGRKEIHENIQNARILLNQNASTTPNVWLKRQINYLENKIKLFEQNSKRLYVSFGHLTP